MSASTLPIPKPNEKLVLVIEIKAPDNIPIDSVEYIDFSHKVTAFKKELSQAVTENFAGALTAKMMLKKHAAVTIGGTPVDDEGLTADPALGV